MKKKIKILLLINWHIHYFLKEQNDIQPSDQCYNKRFWFFKYFKSNVEVDVVDTRSLDYIEKFEKNHLRIYIMQTLRILKNVNDYDVIISHGTTSAIFFDFIKRLFKIKTPPHIVIDISSFHQASTKGMILKLCQFASKSIDYLIYHTPVQTEYFDNYFPWLRGKKQFITFGVDEEYWNKRNFNITEREYIVCVGYRRRDWVTLIKGYKRSSKKYKLILIGNSKLKVNDDMIEVRGFMPINELMNCVGSAKFSVLPLNSFNFSYGQMTLLQQMAIGKVVLSADVPSLASYQSPGLIKYKANDYKDLCKKLNKLFYLTSEELNKLGVKNREKCKNIYSEKVMAQSIEEIVKKALLKQ